MDSQPGTTDRFIPAAVSAKLWQAVTGLFVVFGLLPAANTLWSVGADLHARQSWPQARGELTSISEKSLRSLSRRTRYWVEYVVRVVVPSGQCRTAVTDGVEGGLRTCVGTVRTRSTNSTFTAGTWVRESFHDRSVQVLYDPDGPDIKIVGESPWLRYNWEGIATNVVWLVVFGTGLSIARRRFRALQQEKNAAAL
jgi:hypothetical protein